MPDSEFISLMGYDRIRCLSYSTPAFESRRDIVLWRGSSTGDDGVISLPDMTAETPGLLLRTQMCLLLKDVSGCDVRIRRCAAGNVLPMYVDLPLRRCLVTGLILRSGQCALPHRN